MQSFLKELEMESVGTRKMLALVPADKGDFKPHEKSMTLKNLATHIADIPTWVNIVIETDELDFAPYQPKEANGGEALVQLYNENVEKAIQILNTSSDDILEKTWVLRNGEMKLMELSKLETIRHSFCQIVHHRAQLGVYLRLLNIPIPGVYGPSADEMQH